MSIWTTIVSTKFFTALLNYSHLINIVRSLTGNLFLPECPTNAIMLSATFPIIDRFIFKPSLLQAYAFKIYTVAYRILTQHSAQCFSYIGENTEVRQEIKLFRRYYWFYILVQQYYRIIVEGCIIINWMGIRKICLNIC